MFCSPGKEIKVSIQYPHCRQVTRAKLKSGAVVEHQRMFVVLRTTSNAKRLFKSDAVPLLVTSLHWHHPTSAIESVTFKLLESAHTASSGVNYILNRVCGNVLSDN
jgi:hypothetical protein